MLGKTIALDYLLAKQGAISTITNTVPWSTLLVLYKVKEINKSLGYKTGWCFFRYIIWYQQVWLTGALTKEHSSVSWHYPPNSYNYSLLGVLCSPKVPKCMFGAISSIPDGLTVLEERETRWTTKSIIPWIWHYNLRNSQWDKSNVTLMVTNLSYMRAWPRRGNRWIN